MKFSIAERVGLLGVLPPEGDIVTLRIVRDLKRELSFSEEEISEAGIVNADGWILWNPAVQIEKEIEIGPAALTVIRDALKKLNERKKLTEATMGLYERFIE